MVASVLSVLGEYSFICKDNLSRAQKYTNLSTIVNLSVLLSPSHFFSHLKICTSQQDTFLRGAGLKAERMVEEDPHYSEIPNKNIETVLANS